MSVCIAEEICKGCGICVENCPKHILKLSDRRNTKGANVAEQVTPEKCVKCGKCGTCQDTCPDLAIWVCVEENSEN